MGQRCKTSYHRYHTVLGMTTVRQRLEMPAARVGHPDPLFPRGTVEASHLVLCLHGVSHCFIVVSRSKVTYEIQLLRLEGNEKKGQSRRAKFRFQRGAENSNASSLIALYQLQINLATLSHICQLIGAHKMKEQTRCPRRKIISQNAHLRNQLLLHAHDTPLYPRVIGVISRDDRHQPLNFPCLIFFAGCNAMQFGPNSAESHACTCSRMGLDPQLLLSSLSKKPGSFSILRSNLVHQSWKLFKGTTSCPPPVVVPAKLARKLKAFLMMRCANVFVDRGDGRCRRLLAKTRAVEDGNFEALRDSSWDKTVVACSIDIPTVISPTVVAAAPFVAEDASISVISSST